MREQGRCDLIAEGGRPARTTLVSGTCVADVAMILATILFLGATIVVSGSAAFAIAMSPLAVICVVGAVREIRMRS